MRRGLLVVLALALLACAGNDAFGSVADDVAAIQAIRGRIARGRPLTEDDIRTLVGYLTGHDDDEVQSRAAASLESETAINGTQLPWDDLVAALRRNLQEEKHWSSWLLIETLALSRLESLQGPLAELCPNPQPGFACHAALVVLGHPPTIRAACADLTPSEAGWDDDRYERRRAVFSPFREAGPREVVDCVAPFLLRDDLDPIPIPREWPPDYPKISAEHRDRVPFRPMYTPTWADAVSVMRAINRNLPPAERLPEDPWGFRAWWPAREPAPADARCDPATIQRKAKGEWITCYLEFQDDLYRADPVWALPGPQSVTLGPVPADADPQHGWVSSATAVDEDNDGIPELMVKFDRAAVVTALGGDDEARAVLRGLLRTQRAFEAPVVLRFR